MTVYTSDHRPKLLLPLICSPKISESNFKLIVKKSNTDIYE